MKFSKYYARKGSSLVLALFISAIALFITVTIMNSADKNTGQISDDKAGKVAYYAAEAGIEAATNLFNSDDTTWGLSLASLDLPTQSNTEQLDNDAVYWIDSIDYINSNSTAIIDSVGKFKQALRKIRARITLAIPSVYDDYGLLSNSTITVHGSKTLKMSIHGNGGLSLTGPETMENNAVATQSTDESTGDPNPDTNAIGGYVPWVEVPNVPINDLRTKTQDGLNLCAIDPDLSTKIMNAADGTHIYVGTDSVTCSGFANLNNNNIMYANYNSSPFAQTSFIPIYYNQYPNIQLAKQDEGQEFGGYQGSTTITLNGDLGGKVIFIEGDLDLHASGVQDLSNAMIISSGETNLHGSVDIGTSHEGKVDVIFASAEDITLNGSRDFNALFWTNKSFRQNGSSMAGRVIAQDGITFNGSFTLTPSTKLYDNGMLKRNAIVSSRQQVSMDN